MGRRREEEEECAHPDELDALERALGDDARAVSLLGAPCDHLACRGGARESVRAREDEKDDEQLTLDVADLLAVLGRRLRERTSVRTVARDGEEDEDAPRGRSRRC